MGSGGDERSAGPSAGVIVIEGWGRGLEVRSEESIARLRGFVKEAEAGERWAAVLPWISRRDRHAWEGRLRRAGFQLGEVDRPGDSYGGRAVELLALPAQMAIRISGRRTVTFRVTIQN